MSDLKSKLPDLNELSSMANKLFKDIKASIDGIIKDYKDKHPDEAPAAKASDKPVEEAADSEKIVKKTTKKKQTE